MEIIDAIREAEALLAAVDGITAPLEAMEWLLRSVTDGQWGSAEQAADILREFELNCEREKKRCP